MLIQAGSFMAPYKIWQFFEGGLMEEFGMEAKSNIMGKDDGQGSVFMSQVVEKYVQYFRTILHRNTYYFGKYLVCEILNFIVLFLNFYVTDLFLNGRFYYYGFDVIQYNRSVFNFEFLKQLVFLQF